MRRLLLIALVVTLSACGSGSTDPSETGDVSGSWSGTYASAQIGHGSASVSFAQGGSVLNGTWNTHPDPGGGTSDNSGSISGSNTATGDHGVFTADLLPSDPRTCAFRATFTFFIKEGQMTGDFVTVNCTVAASGVFILTKR